jgi:hypothetical protein
MNLDKIDQFALDAHTDVIQAKISPYQQRRHFEHKFAEMIIADVINIVRTADVRDMVFTTYDKHRVNDIIETIVKEIKSEYEDN